MIIYAFCILFVISADIIFLATFNSLFNLWFKNRTQSVVIPIKKYDQ